MHQDFSIKASGSFESFYLVLLLFLMFQHYLIAGYIKLSSIAQSPRLLMNVLPSIVAGLPVELGPDGVTSVYFSAGAPSVCSLVDYLATLAAFFPLRITDK
jgi:hypothetical protein